MTGVKGGGTVWWGEAADEPAREDARPTNGSKLYHHKVKDGFDDR